MAEVGLLPFCPRRTANRPGDASSLPQPFQHQFTQPQLLAILCLMRSEDWTFREAGRNFAERTRQALREHTNLLLFGLGIDPSRGDILTELMQIFYSVRCERTPIEPYPRAVLLT